MLSLGRCVTINRSEISGDMPFFRAYIVPDESLSFVPLRQSMRYGGLCDRHHCLLAALTSERTDPATGSGVEKRI
jgi:hypothetical protein